MGGKVSAQNVEMKEKAKLQAIINTSAFRRSAIDYNPVFSNFDDNVKKEKTEKLFLCGPVDKKERNHRLELIRKNVYKFQAAKVI